MRNVRPSLALFALSIVLAGCRTETAPAAAPGERVASSDPAVSSRPATVPAAVKTGKSQSLGTFRVTSPEILVSDPCYELGPGGSTDLQGVVRQVKTGVWRAEALDYEAGPKDVRCAELRTYHQTHAHAGACHWVPEAFTVGVDSGQAGVFDRSHFRDNTVVPKTYRWHGTPIDADSRWYSLCSDITLNGTAGVIPYGAVASSGYGDGGYECFVCKQNDQVVGIRLVFISQESEDEQ